MNESLLMHFRQYKTEGARSGLSGPVDRFPLALAQDRANASLGPFVIANFSPFLEFH